MIRHFKQLCRSGPLAQAAHRASLDLMVKHDLRYNLDRWDNEVFAAFEGEEVIGFMQFNVSETAPTLDVTLAWVHPHHPTILAALMGRLRAYAREKSVNEITFTRHAGNETMGRLAEVTKAELMTLTYSIMLGDEG